MTEREVLKLALEALETCEWVDDGGNGHAEYNPRKVVAALRAVKEALKQPEQEPVCYKHGDEPKKGCAWCDKQPAQQEHVATSDTSEKRVDEMAKQRHEPEPVAWFRYETVYEYKNQLARCTKDCIGAFPVYTTPPQPEQSQVEETLRYEIDALETKLAECRAHQQEPVIDKSAAVRIATALGWEPKRKPLTEERIDDIWNYHCDELGYVSLSDAVELTRSIEALHDIKE